MNIKNLFKSIRNTKTKGITLIEVTIVIVVMLIVAVGGVSSYSSMINKAKMALLLNDFASLKVACTQMYYEHSGLGVKLATEGAFYETFNQYVDSNSNLMDDNKTLLKSDPWGAPYQVKFTQVSETETKITIDSVGKSNKVDYELLVHYKNGEVRAGTAGFDKNEGSDTSDAKTTNGVASITDMWAK
jgi:type II secretory pathway pseudopilin PulG